MPRRAPRGWSSSSTSSRAQAPLSRRLPGPCSTALGSCAVSPRPRRCSGCFKQRSSKPSRCSSQGTLPASSRLAEEVAPAWPASPCEAVLHASAAGHVGVNAEGTASSLRSCSSGAYLKHAVAKASLKVPYSLCRDASSWNSQRHGGHGTSALWPPLRFPLEAALWCTTPWDAATAGRPTSSTSGHPSMEPPRGSAASVAMCR